MTEFASDVAKTLAEWSGNVPDGLFILQEVVNFHHSSLLKFLCIWQLEHVDLVEHAVFRLKPHFAELIVVENMRKSAC